MLQLPLEFEEYPHVVGYFKRFFWIHSPLIIILCSLLLILFQKRIDWNLTLEIDWYDFFLLIPLPFALLSLCGLSLPHQRYELSESPLRKLNILYICIVTRGTNKQIVENSYWIMKSLESEQVRLKVVSDCPLDIPHILVPHSFQTKFAKYKARALEYFRIKMNLSDRDWVLHLDEESVIDSDNLAACIDFCRNSPHLMGQGSILYNHRNFWKHPLITVADCIRVGDDLARFYLQFAYLHQPIFGIHGSFLLINGKVENEITWDLSDSLTEDYEFSVQYMRQGYTCGYVDGVVREQSPESILDFLKQRRRWLLGIRTIAKHSNWARLWTLLWSLNPVILGIAMALSTNLIGGGKPISCLMFIPMMLISAIYLYLYLLGSLVQDLDRKSNLVEILLHTLATSVLYPLAFMLESLAVIWSYISIDRRIGFQIVEKN